MCEYSDQGDLIRLQLMVFNPASVWLFETRKMQNIDYFEKSYGKLNISIQLFNKLK